MNKLLKGDAINVGTIKEYNTPEGRKVLFVKYVVLDEYGEIEEPKVAVYMTNKDGGKAILLGSYDPSYLSGDDFLKKRVSKEK